MRRGRFFGARRRCTRNLFYRTVSHVTRPSRWPADMVTVLQTSRQITVLKDTLREAQDGRADGFWKKSQARVFILHLQIIGAWFALPRSPPARCVKRRAKDLQGDSSAAGQLLGFAQLWRKWESPSRICLRGRSRHIGSHRVHPIALCCSLWELQLPPTPT